MTANSRAGLAASKKKKILIVDDERDIIIYLTTLLRENGYEVFYADGAEEAMEKILEHKPDLVCLDVMMPRQSGIALYRKFKLDQRSKDIPAIFISAFGLAHKLTGKGFRKYVPEPEVPEPKAYLEKPVKAQTILEVIEGAIG